MSATKDNRKNMRYSHGHMTAAIDMVRRGFSIRRAAKEHEIPESTIRHKLSVHTSAESKRPGRPTVLLKQEEDRIIAWIIEMARSGFPVDSQRIKTSVAHYLKSIGRSNFLGTRGPGRKWLKLFLKRHPKISRRIPSSLSKQRTYVTEDKIRSWFGEVYRYIRQADLEDVLKDPERIFNMDESSIRLVPTKETVYAETGDNYVHTSNANSEKECYTVLFSASAAGVLAPPMILFPFKQRLPAEIAKSAPDGWSIGKNLSGWMTQETFYEYLKNVFYPWLLRSKVPLPVLVFVDGHKSHVSLQTTEFCREKQIVLICLFANSTHVLQPLDVTFFRALKVNWNKRLIDWRTFRAGEPLKRYEFAPLLKRAVDDMINIKSTLSNGFRKCGLYPWNPNAVNYAMLLQTDNSTALGSASMQPAIDMSQNSETNTIFLGLESYLTIGQLKRFEENYPNAIWTGPVGDTNLFYIWQKIKRETSGSQTKQKELELEQKEEFQGFEDSDMNVGRHNIDLRYASIEQQAVPSPDVSIHAESVTIVQVKPQQSKQSTEDNFKRSFFKPSVSVASTKPMKKYRPRAPVVATSEQYKKYFEDLEQEKNKIDQERLQKKAAREKKKQIQEKHKKQSLKKITKKKKKEAD